MKVWGYIMSWQLNGIRSHNSTVRSKDERIGLMRRDYRKNGYAIVFMYQRWDDAGNQTARCNVCGLASGLETELRPIFAEPFLEEGSSRVRSSSRFKVQVSESLYPISFRSCAILAMPQYAN